MDAMEIADIESMIDAMRSRVETAKQLRMQATQDAPSKTDRDIAFAIHEVLMKQDELDELRAIEAKIQTLSDSEVPSEIRDAFKRAKEAPTYSRLQALVREFIRLQEEEEAALLMLLAG